MERHGVLNVKVLTWFTFGLVLFVAVFISASDSVAEVLYGQCIANGLSEMNDIKTAIHGLESKTPGESSEPITIKLGDCIGSILFANRDYVFGNDIAVSGSLECPSGYQDNLYQGYIILGPSVDIEETGWEFWKKWADKPKSMVRDFLEEYGIVQNLCKALASTGDSFEEPGGQPITLDGPRGNEGTKTYCIHADKTGEHKYKIVVEKESKC